MNELVILKRVEYNDIWRAQGFYNTMIYACRDYNDIYNYLIEHGYKIKFEYLGADDPNHYILFYKYLDGDEIFNRHVRFER